MAGRWPISSFYLVWVVFLGFSSLSLLLLLWLGYSGFRLVRKDEGAIRRAPLPFLAELLYFISYVVVFWLVLPMKYPSIQTTTLGFWDLAQAPLDPQVATGYPLIALIVMLILKHKKPETYRPSGRSQPTPSR